MRIIAHLDLDAFFAAVEERDRPWLAGRPIVIGADPKEGKGRGVVSTANYRARQFGIGSAMPITKAWEAAKKAEKNNTGETVFLCGSHGKYSDISRSIMHIARDYAPAVEQASVDEVYLDLSHTGSWERAKNAATRIKKDIYKEEKLTCSIGIGPNKLLAKIASDEQKPDGLTVVTKEEVADFLAPKNVRIIPGVGPKSAATLEKKGITTVAQARKLIEPELEQLFGVWGQKLYKKLRGIDNTLLVEERETKSIGKHHTFEQDTLDPQKLGAALIQMAGRIIMRMERKGFSGFRTVTLTVRFTGFTTRDRSHTLKKPADTQKTLLFEANRLLVPFLDTRKNPKKKKIRLLGLRISNLSK